MFKNVGKFMGSDVYVVDPGDVPQHIFMTREQWDKFEAMLPLSKGSCSDQEKRLEKVEAMQRLLLKACCLLTDVSDSKQKLLDVLDKAMDLHYDRKGD